jgi:hypothetical protein
LAGFVKQCDVVWVFFNNQAVSFEAVPDKIPTLIGAVPKPVRRFLRTSLIRPLPSQAFAYPSLLPGQSGVPPCALTAAGTHSLGCLRVQLRQRQSQYLPQQLSEADLAVFRETKVMEKSIYALPHQ